VRLLFRIFLIFIALYLVARYLSAVFRPKKPTETVQGSPRKSKRIDENRIQDANFKDLPKE
jgi:hypothetical protein